MEVLIDTEPIARAHKRSQAACCLCRASKTRCIHDRNLHNSCVRCQRFGLHCSYPTASKKRGRPSKAAQSNSFSEESHKSQEFARPFSPTSVSDTWPQSHPQGQMFNFDTSSNNGMVDPNILPRLTNLPPPPQSSIPAPISQSQSNAQTIHQPRPSLTSNGSATMPLQSESTLTSPSNTTSPQHDVDRGINMSEYLDPNDRSLQLHPPKVPFFLCQPSPDTGGEGDDATMVTPSLYNITGQDPISLGLLSEAEAYSLVQQFHDQFNPHVAVLDRKMHTLSYMRQHTVILLSTVLAATAKLYRRDLCPQLLSHANTILDRALLRGVTHISLMQSLMVLTYTKAPSDTSAWRRIGMAIRMGYQMHLHIPRHAPLPEDETAARVMLNAERTWYCLFCFDRGLGHVFGLPYTIRLTEIGNCEAWAREHTYLGPSVDMHLAASIELCRAKDSWGAIFDHQYPSPSSCESAIDNMRNEAEAMYSKWFGNRSQLPGFTPESEHVISWCMLDFMFTLKRQHYELGPHLPMRLDACLSVASQIVDEIEQLGKAGVLGIMQDTASCMTSSLGIFFHKVFMTATMNQKSLMISLLQRILSSHVSVINGDEKSAPAHVVRCIKRILGAIRSDSRAGSPAPGQNPTAAELSLQELFGQFEDTVDPMEGFTYTTGDEQFWQMLFSA